jgi:hypothetical protein
MRRGFSPSPLHFSRHCGELSWREKKVVGKFSTTPHRWIFTDAKGGKAQGLRLAVVIIAVSLAAGIATSVSPPLTKAWILSVLFVVVTVVATFKFTALSILFFRRSKRILGLLWGAVAVAFILLFMAALQYLGELPR